MADNYFIELNRINLNDVKEQKNKLDYISWAWAWTKVKELHPDAYSKVYENADGWNYFTDGRTCWVKVGMTVNGLEHIEYLPVMDYHNQSIPLAKVTSMDVNKAIQRGLTKAIARHGLGLYVYAGEDLPDEEDGNRSVPQPTEQKTNDQKNKTAVTTGKPTEAECAQMYKSLQELCPDKNKLNSILLQCGCKGWKEMNAFVYSQAEKMLNET